MASDNNVNKISNTVKNVNFHFCCFCSIRCANSFLLFSTNFGAFQRHDLVWSDLVTSVNFLSLQANWKILGFARSHHPSSLSENCTGPYIYISRADFEENLPFLNPAIGGIGQPWCGLTAGILQNTWLEKIRAPSGLNTNLHQRQ